MTCPCHSGTAASLPSQTATAAPVATARRPTPITQCLACAQKHLDDAWLAYNEHTYQLTNFRWIRANLRAVVSHTFRAWPDIADLARDLALDIQEFVVSQETFERFDALAKAIDERFLAEYPEAAARLEKLQHETA